MSSTTLLTPSISAVLLDEPGYLAPLRAHANDPKRASRDGSFLLVLLEELVVKSASKIAIPCTSLDYKFADHLPKTVGDQISVLYEEDLQKAVDLRAGLLNPIMRHFEVPIRDQYFTHYSIDSFVQSSKISSELNNTIHRVLHSVGRFFLGLQHNLSINFDLHEMIRYIRYIRGHCKDSQLRLSLASFEQILMSYQSIDIPTLGRIHVSRVQAEDSFGQLIEDLSFKELSEHSKNLTISTQIQHSLSGIKRSAQTIVNKPLFKPFFNFGTRCINLATQIPLPDSDFAETLLSSSFLPPILPLDTILDDTMTYYDRYTPDPIFLSDKQLDEIRKQEDERIIKYYNY